MKALLLVMMACMLPAAVIEKTIDELLEGNADTTLSVPKYDPFYRAVPLLKQKTTPGYKPKTKKVEVSAIMNGRAFIGGKWYAKGDKYRGGKVIKVSSDTVYIQFNKGMKVLRLHKQAPLFTIKDQ